eukprot:ANDGO_03828.mRNA.1 hypothetical protein
MFGRRILLAGGCRGVFHAGWRSSRPFSRMLASDPVNGGDRDVASLFRPLFAKRASPTRSRGDDGGQKPEGDVEDVPYFTKEELQKGNLTTSDYIAFSQGLLTAEDLENARYAAQVDLHAAHGLSMLSLADPVAEEMHKDTEFVAKLTSLAMESREFLLSASAQNLSDQLEGHVKRDDALLQKLKSTVSEFQGLFRDGLERAQLEDLMLSVEQRLEFVNTRFIGGHFLSRHPMTVYPSFINKIRNWVFLMMFRTRSKSLFEQDEFLEGTRIAYPRLCELMTRRDLTALGRLCNPTARLAIISKCVREDVANRRMVNEIVKIHDNFIHSAGIHTLRTRTPAEREAATAAEREQEYEHEQEYGDQGTVHMGIGVTFVAAEKCFVVHADTGLPTKDPTCAGIHTLHRVWAFDCEFDLTDPAPFENSQYKWKFGGPKIDSD